jgi:AmiR/NasT family two-component response regulator
VSVDDDLESTSTDLLASLANQVEQLEVAVDHRTIIGQAQGVLMARLDIDADTAFDYLKRVSSHTNTKLIVIAEEISRTRALPDVQI